jgi:hypothetical protein
MIEEFALTRSKHKASSLQPGPVQIDPGFQPPAMAD